MRALCNQYGTRRKPCNGFIINLASELSSGLRHTLASKPSFLPHGVPEYACSAQHWRLVLSLLTNAGMSLHPRLQEGNMPALHSHGSSASALAFNGNTAQDFSIIYTTPVDTTLRTKRRLAALDLLGTFHPDHPCFAATKYS